MNPVQQLQKPLEMAGDQAGTKNSLRWDHAGDQGAKMAPVLAGTTLGTTGTNFAALGTTTPPHVMGWVGPAPQMTHRSAPEIHP